jgi:Flp pilus assembly protein TadG
MNGISIRRLGILRVPCGSGSRAAVSLIFAIAIVPLLMMVGLAIDFGFYTQADAELNMAADSAAMHAVRIALQLYEKGDSSTAAAQAAQTVATNWYGAQLGHVAQLQSAITPTISVTFNAGTNQFTAKVNYAGVIVTHFGQLFPGSWPEYPNWGIAGAATAVISTLTYSEFDFLVDDSSSMLIAADPTGIRAMEAATPCSAAAAAVQQTTPQPLIGTPTAPGGYSWYYDASGALDNNSPNQAPNAPGVFVPYGYGIFNYTVPGPNGTTQAASTNEYFPPPAASTGRCDPAFTGDSTPGSPTDACFYVPGQTTAIANPILNPAISPTTKLCTSGGGTSNRLNAQKQVYTQTNVPQAPCAFACHTDAGNNDYYGVARANNVTLRFDVVQSALTNQTVTQTDPTLGVIPTLENYVQSAGSLNPVSVGVYYFNAGFTTAVAAAPPTGAATSLTALQNAETIVQGIQPQVVTNLADTNIPNAMTQMYNAFQSAGAVGNGLSPTAPQKNMIIVTDGMEDYIDASGHRQEGALSATSLQECSAIKALGVKIFVLYTTYYPLPNPYYLTNDIQYAEPTGPSSLIYQNLQQCASPGTATNPTIIEATDGTQIATALNTLVQSAFGSPGRLSN